jgi:hypothetical protein
MAGLGIKGAQKQTARWKMLLTFSTAQLLREENAHQLTPAGDTPFPPLQPVLRLYDTPRKPRQTNIHPQNRLHARKAGRPKQLSGFSLVPTLSLFGARRPIQQRFPVSALQGMSIGGFPGLGQREVLRRVERAQDAALNQHTARFDQGFEGAFKEKQQVRHRYQIETLLRKRQSEGIGASQLRVKRILQTALIQINPISLASQLAKVSWQ